MGEAWSPELLVGPELKGDLRPLFIPCESSSLILSCSTQIAEAKIYFLSFQAWEEKKQACLD